MPLWSFSDALPEQPSRAGLAGAETARACSDIAATDMVVDSGIVPGFSAAGGTTPGVSIAAAPIDFKAVAHLKWSPRQQPERAPEVKRAIRDAVDRSGLSMVLSGPVPTRSAFMNIYLGTMPAAALEARYAMVLRRWWDLNTILYYLISPAIALGGPLARSDSTLVDSTPLNENGHASATA